MKKIELGVYKHFKGNRYRVLGIAKSSETLEDMVVYEALYGEHALWVRPASEWFNEVVDGNGDTVYRFVYEGP